MLGGGGRSKGVGDGKEVGLVEGVEDLGRREEDRGVNSALRRAYVEMVGRREGEGRERRRDSRRAYRDPSRSEIADAE